MLRPLLAIALLCACVARADDTPPPGPLPEGVTPARYRLKLTIDPRKKDFAGQTDIDVTLRAPQQTIWLHGLGLTVSSVSVTSAGKTMPARYEEVEHESGVARIVTDAPVAAGKATLKLRYTAAFQSAPQGLYRTQAGKDWYAFSQMEAIDARRVFPGFDEPRFKTPFEVTLVTTGGDRAVTNTPETQSTRLKSGPTQYKYLTTKPLPTYLLAFAVGPLEIVDGPPVPPNGVRRAPLPLRVVGTRQADAARFNFALAQAPDIIARLESYFGIAFPYPKIDLIASPIHGGAMENAGAIIFDEALLAFAHEPTPRQQANFGVVAAHELAHHPLLEQALLSLYGERLRKLGYDATPGHYSAEPAEQQLLRRQLIGLVGLTGRSAEVRSAMASAADRSAQNPDAVEPLFRWRIWAIGLQERGAPMFVALKKLAIDSPDAQVRADASTALGYGGAAVSSDALDTSLDPRLEVGPATRIVFQQMDDPGTRDGAWKWFAAHRDAALARVPAMFQSFYAGVGNAFCSTEGRQSFNTVLGERLRSASGGEVQVDRALEGINDCVALRAAVGDSIRSTLQKQ